MKVILINGRHGGSRAIELGRWSRAFLSLCCLGLPLGLVAAGYLAGLGSEARSAALDSIQEGLDRQSVGLEALQNEAELKLQALTINLAELQARMTRLDALGEHLATMADLGDGEFDFSQPPAVGGPLASDYSVDFSSVDLGSELDSFESRLADREPPGADNVEPVDVHEPQAGRTELVVGAACGQGLDILGLWVAQGSLHRPPLHA